MTRSAFAAAVLFLAACSSFAVSSDRIRQALIGTPARDLRACIGVPVDSSTDGDSEYLTFRWAEEDDEPLLLDPQERVDQQRRERVKATKGAVGKGPEDDDDTRPEDELRRSPLEKPPVGYCELIFELRGGQVRGVQAEGRSSDGLNRDADCMARARRCVPPEKLRG